VPSLDSAVRSRGAPQLFRLFGYAGTGKTTLARAHSRPRMSRGTVVFAAFTGKAALKSCATRAARARQTIHSLIYRSTRRVDEESRDLRPQPRERRASQGQARSSSTRCSMVGEELGSRPALLRHEGAGAGRSGAAPARQGHAAIFTEAEPDIMLTEVHRQAKPTTPIVRIVHRSSARAGGSRSAEYGDGARVITRDPIIGADDRALRRIRSSSA
jgi:exodeoxyribonuclease-5